MKFYPEHHWIYRDDSGCVAIQVVRRDIQGVGDERLQFAFAI